MHTLLTELRFLFVPAGFWWPGEDAQARERRCFIFNLFASTNKLCETEQSDHHQLAVVSVLSKMSEKKIETKKKRELMLNLVILARRTILQSPLGRSNVSTVCEEIEMEIRNSEGTTGRNRGSYFHGIWDESDGDDDDDVYKQGSYYSGCTFSDGLGVIMYQ